MAATSIGHRLRKLRESKDLGQDWIAHELGMSVSGYSRIERDEVKITYDKLERIASILKVPVTAIVNQQEAVHAKNVAHSNEHPVAANNHNQSVEIEKLETLYREQIISLREEVAYLRELLKKTMEK
ncbi:MAG: helix-turn-helix domain-containing protein [Bacteroidota bacterium]|jgi:transcriptional regulator with XRE-family HTH domain